MSTTVTNLKGRPNFDIQLVFYSHIEHYCFLNCACFQREFVIGEVLL